jgi:hypothetical protein
MMRAHYDVNDKSDDVSCAVVKESQKNRRRSFKRRRKFSGIFFRGESDRCRFKFCDRKFRSVSLNGDISASNTFSRVVHKAIGNVKEK